MIFVDDTYYDSLIVKNCKLRYMNCSRVIGRIMSGTMVSELLVDWRIRILLEKKFLIGKGPFKLARNFAIRRRGILKKALP